MGLQGKGYKMDIVFVIDATGSMTPIMNEVKANALSLGDKITEALKAANKNVDELRLRVIDFADFASEGEDAIRLSDFYTMPEQKAEFEARINNIDIDMRGGDIPENALEALYAAINSDWVKIGAGEKGRHIIVLMTDAVPLNLQERAGCVGYHADEYPSNIEELTEIWSADSQSSITKLSPTNKRLIIFAPTGSDKAGHTWDDVTSWEWVTGATVDPAKGLAELDLSVIIAEIVRSA